MIKHIVRVDDDFFNHLNQIIDAVNNFTPEKADDSDLKKTIPEMRAEIDRLKKKLAKQQDKIIKNTQDLDVFHIDMDSLFQRIKDVETDIHKMKESNEKVSIVNPELFIKPKKVSRWQKIKQKMCAFMLGKLDI